MAQAHFPGPPDLSLTVNERIGYGQNKNLGKWTVANPHPGYGKDPNIGNELGHTVYPKYVTLENGEQKIVYSPGEENELTNNISDEGPTIKEYVEAGFKASEYPPKGYAAKSTPEEIEEYVAAETAANKHHGWK
jgi:hypothetical protein